MNTAKEGKMWFLHCQLLTEIMVQILKKNKGTGDPGNGDFLENLFIKKIVTAFKQIKEGDIVASQKDSEYIFFKIIQKDERNKEIYPIIDGLSGPAFQVASVLTHEHLDREKNKITALTKTALWHVLAIGYFNRKICLGAEGVVSKEEKCHNGNEKNWYEKNKGEDVNDILDGKVDTSKPEDSKAMELFLKCLRPRLNYIGARPYDKYEKNPFKKENGEYGIEKDNYKVENLVTLYNGLSKDVKLDVPFSKQIHRLRKRPENSPSDVHLLGIDAGAHINAITQESTLGKIRQSLGLPLRCDISGTTVDAMGFCDTFIKKGENGDNEKRMVYLVSCMLSMCLTGHHSLDEMALALSLDVKEEAATYDPCNPATVVGLLTEWSGWTGFDFSDKDTEYFNTKAAGILRLDKPLKKLEFTQKLWDDLAKHNKIMKGWTYKGDELIPPKDDD